MTASPASPHDLALRAELRPVRAGPRFQAGGSLGEGALYVERAADRDLFESLQRGELCYVLATRQIGKSSLRARVAARLHAEGVASAHIDLTARGVRDVSAADWYFGLTFDIAEQIGLDDPNAFWDARKGLGAVHVFSLYLEELGRVAGRVAIFIDEIDATLALPFSRDDFFAALRAHQNHRAESADAARLSLCLLGVAAPEDLIADPALTPFNIGRAIRLEDFSRQEMEAFGAGLPGTAAEVSVLLDAIYAWTGGHPYMTQRVCSDLVDLRRGETVDTIVQARFLERGKAEDANLAHVERFLDLRAKSGQVPRLLSLYERVLERDLIPADGSDPLQLTLRLAGLVAEREEGGARRLVVRNRIFREVYGATWVRERMAARPLAAAVEQWRAGGRKKADLLRGGRLTDAQRWAAQRNDLTQDEQAFLEACARATAASRLWVIVGLVVVVLLLAIAFTLAWRAQKRADEAVAKARTAEARAKYNAEILDIYRLAATSEAVGANQQQERLLLAVEAVKGAMAVGAAVPGQIERALIGAVSETFPRVTLARGVLPLVYAAVSPDRHRAIIIDRDGTATLLSLNDEVEPKVQALRPKATSAAFGTDGTFALTASGDAAVFMADADTLEAFRYPTHGLMSTSASFSHDGTHLAIGLAGGVVSVVETKLHPSASEDLQGSPRSVTSIDWNIDGVSMVIGLEDGTVETRRIDRPDATIRIRAAVAGRNSGPTHAVWSPDGKWIAWANRRSIYVKGMDSTHLPTLLGTLNRASHEDEIVSISYSPDGTRIVTASKDNTARIWRPEYPDSFIILRGHADALLTAVFSNDGTRVFSIDAKGIMRTWLVSLELLLQQACALAGRNFTRDEWSRHMLSWPYAPSYRKTCDEWSLETPQ